MPTHHSALKKSEVLNIIGWDCAVDFQNMGLCHARYHDQKCELKTIYTPQSQIEWQENLKEVIHSGGKTLICMDIPLGWPKNFRSILSNHLPGQPLPADPDFFFRRETDLYIKKKLGKTPLDIAADRIARATQKSLVLLNELRQHLKITIPLAWENSFQEDVLVIETYPAAVLRYYQLEFRKLKDQPLQQIKILESLKHRVTISKKLVNEIKSHHIFDSILCVVAGTDFCEGLCDEPTDRSKVQDEGWIWARIQKD